MPTVAVDRDELFERLGRTYTEEEFDELCFQFGVELDEVMTEAEASAARGLSESATGGAISGAGRVLYYIAIPANRTDLLCIEGIARALNVFLGRIPDPHYAIDNSAAPGGSIIEMVVKPSTQAIRPYVVCAVLRGVTFTPSRYKSFIDLQDKLHANIARRRTLVAIGTHDLDTLTPPFRYEAKAPADISFVPLTQSRTFRADELMEFYRTDPTVKHIKPYVPILENSPVYPVIYDSKDVLLSLPPIINGDHSKISLATRNVFIECTGTDLTKAHVVLNTVVAMFSEYAAKPFAVEEVRVTYEGGYRGMDAQVTPDLSTRPALARLSSLRSIIGDKSLTAETAARHATKMQLAARPGRALVVDGEVAVAGAAGAAGKEDEEVVFVDVPITRADVLHECDICEDVAIAYGYNNIARTLPSTSCPGAQQPINKLTDSLRHELAAAGYDEVLTLALVSREENYRDMRLPEDDLAVVLANPQTVDFQIGRTRLLPGLLKALSSNKGTVSFSSGVKVFEVSDVMLKDSAADVGARNERRLAALYSGVTAGFEVVHGLVDRVMELLEVPVRPYAWCVAAAGGAGGPGAAAVYGRGGLRYSVEPQDSPTYFPGRGASIVIEKADGSRTVIGSLGVLHPEVLKSFGLDHPASVVEFNIEPFVAAAL